MIILLILDNIVLLKKKRKIKKKEIFLKQMFIQEDEPNSPPKCLYKKRNLTHYRYATSPSPYRRGGVGVGGGGIPIYPTPYLILLHSKHITQ